MNQQRQLGRAISNMLVLLIIGIAVGAWILDSPKPPPPAEKAVRQPPPAAGKGYALRATDNSWPRISADSDGPEINADLLTENYYVLLDGSGSMQEKECADGASKMQVALQALNGFLDNLPAEANFGLSVFINGKVRELLPLQARHSVKAGRLPKQIRPGGPTPLRSAIAAVYKKLEQQGRRQLGYGQFHLIVITDGLPSEGQNPTKVVNKILMESPVTLHTIGFCIDSNNPLNQPGRAFYHSAGNPAELAQGLDSVLAEAPQFDTSQFGD